MPRTGHVYLSCLWTVGLYLAIAGCQEFKNDPALRNPAEGRRLPDQANSKSQNPPVQTQPSEEVPSEAVKPAEPEQKFTADEIQ